MKVKPRFEYYCNDCNKTHKSIWVLRFCTHCKSKNIIRSRLPKECTT
jgi:Zn finger protein HypA/HybF involved in hydrogenase expression